jgi:amidase
LIRRATLLREWLLFLQTYPVQGDDAFARVWRAQMPQLGLPYLGLPALTGPPDRSAERPSVTKVVSGRCREDLCPAAGEAIEAGGTPPAPVDPPGD